MHSCCRFSSHPKNFSPPPGIDASIRSRHHRHWQSGLFFPFPELRRWFPAHPTGLATGWNGSFPWDSGSGTPAVSAPPPPTPQPGSGWWSDPEARAGACASGQIPSPPPAAEPPPFAPAKNPANCDRSRHWNRSRHPRPCAPEPDGSRPHPETTPDCSPVRVKPPLCSASAPAAGSAEPPRFAG